MQRGTGQVRVRLKDSAYALLEPQTSNFINLEGERPRLVERVEEATLAPASREGLARLATLASYKLANFPHELVRVDAL